MDLQYRGQRLPRLSILIATAIKAADQARPPLNKLAYNIAEAAEAVGLTPKGIRAAIECGELRAVKRRGKWLISRDNLKRWLAD